MRSRRILMVTYGFPPRGGGGVQRNCKLIKYFNRLNCEIDVLTVKDTFFHTRDQTLYEEVSKYCTIHKTESFDPLRFYKTLSIKNYTKSHKYTKINETGKIAKIYRVIRNWFMIPDAYIGWYYHAIKYYKNNLRNVKYDIVFASFPPATNVIIAELISRVQKVPLHIDMRDPWSDDSNLIPVSKLHKLYSQYIEQKYLKKSAIITTFNEKHKNVLKKRLSLNNVYTVTNGYDHEDLNLSKKFGSRFREDKGKICIVYNGSISVDRQKTFECFLKSLQYLNEEYFHKIKIHIVGNIQDWLELHVKKHNLANIVKLHGYKSHLESIEFLKQAHFALMCLHADDQISYTGKIFEYIGLNKKILACVNENGECAKLLSSIGFSQGVLGANSPEMIGKKLNIALQTFEEQFSYSKKTLKMYSREEQAKTILELYDKCL